MTAKKTKAPATVVGTSIKSPRTSTRVAVKMDDTAHLNSSPKNAARLQASAAQVKTSAKRQVLPLEAGAVDGTQLDVLVSLLQQRMGVAASSSKVTGEVNSNYGQQFTSEPAVGTSLKTANPIDNEISLIQSNLDEVHGLIADLSNQMDAFLAHEELSDSKADCPAVTRTSESPLHRRLIDRNDTLDNIIARLRYLKSRIRN